MESFTDYRAHRRLPDLSLAAASILGFWLFYFATIVIRTWLIEENFAWLSYRALGCVIGIILTFLVYVVLSRAARESVRIQIVAAAIACVPAAAIFSTFNLAFAVQQPLPERTVIRQGPDGTSIAGAAAGDEVRIGRKGVQIISPLPADPQLRRQKALRLIADGLVTWYFFFAAWASFYIAISSAARLRTAERRAAGAERDAQAAQLRALRYQVNPHFLFNTLNSLSSLVMARRDEEAEAMIVNLSAFFRSSLALDPSEDISLAQEIEFQQLYLDIEKARFPKRLDVRNRRSGRPSRRPGAAAHPSASGRECDQARHRPNRRAGAPDHRRPRGGCPAHPHRRERSRPDRAGEGRARHRRRPGQRLRAARRPFRRRGDTASTARFPAAAGESPFPCPSS